ncbi:Smr/MutS family protein [Sphingomonas aracearum]|uniref:DNA mismatch repair protein MutS n=1 Tax=Sphingomonas aracearum TaxID=2283317 RepID=A0A369VWV9_9SPHN|nr:Smr/MutS family protein [Sphingomonas aracearum]RDE06828.1 DNA mismatch repair protein MutS [Sphingomonas aracearum]
MADRPLSPDERALWARVLVSVRPLHRTALPVRAAAATTAQARPVAAPPPARAAKAKAGRVPAAAPAPPPPPPAARPLDSATLDGSWDRQVTRGLVVPDRTVDLHGHNLHSAYGLLDDALERAIAAGDRVILLVTGKPPRPESERPHARGAIRAAVNDWLAGSRHSSAIAAVRGAHPRHGGSGALYIVLRRARDPRR